MELVRDEAIAALCAEATGSMRRLLTYTLEYIQQRRQFGQSLAIATLTLNRPDVLNAISLELIADFNSALDAISDAPTPARCVVLTGAGRTFCVGGDITAHRDRPSDIPPYDLGDTLTRYFNPLLLRLMTLPVPLVIAVNGAAAGE